VDIDYALNDGDVVEIFTNPNVTPDKNWLNHVQSSKTREKIHHWLKTVPRAIGLHRLEQAMQKNKVGQSVENTRTKIDEFIKSRDGGIDTLLDDIGNGVIDADALVNSLFMEGDWKTEARAYIPKNELNKLPSARYRIKIARCCNPDYPDEIVGSLQNAIATAHRVSCKNGIRAKKHVSLKWATHESSLTSVKIKIKAHDRTGLIRDVADIITNHSLGMEEFNALSRDGLAEISFILKLPTPAIPQTLLGDLRAIHEIDDINIPEPYLRLLNYHSVQPAFNHTQHGGMGNPYSPGRSSIEKVMFFGRRKETRQIIDYLTPASHPTSILLYGQRRVGKTSLAIRIRNYRNIGKEYIPVYIDCTASKSSDDYDLLNRMIYYIKEQGCDFPDLKKKRSVQDMYLQFEKGLVSFKKKNHKHLLFIFDEFEAVLIAKQQGTLSNTFFSAIRSWSQNKPVTFLIVGSNRLKSEITSNFSELATVFLSQKLGALSSHDARMLVIEPAHGRLQYENNAIEIILYVTRCYPYYIHLICAKLYDHALETFKTTITQQDVENTLFLIYKDLSAQNNFSHLWNNNSPQHEIVLTYLAYQKNPGGWVDVKEILGMSKSKITLKEALRELLELDTIERSDDKYRIRLPLFAEWILKNYPHPINS